MQDVVAPGTHREPGNALITAVGGAVAASTGDAWRSRVGDEQLGERHGSEGGGEWECSVAAS